MNNEPLFITTTLPYANSKPHIGHAFEFILGDAFARWHRFRGWPVIFNIGLDEHGTKIYEAAKANGKYPLDYLEDVKEQWVEFCDLYNIAPDNFYRTSSDDHHVRVKCVWNILVDKGDIYKKEYEGLYCTGCESYKKLADLEKSDTQVAQCPDHPTTILRLLKEENYFFRLTKYKQDLLDWLKNTREGDEFLRPEEKRTELINLIDDLQDISVSRLYDTCPWGISVPNDDSQVIYVWFDALLNYIFAAGYLSGDEGFETKWSHATQLCGPDNLRFQAIIFQALLKALDINYSKHLIVHGTIKDELGRKMSKTLGNTIDPVEQVNKYGVDAVRYYALAGLSTYQDTKWNEGDLVNLWNANVCNGLGNVVARVLHLIDTKAGGLVGDQVDPILWNQWSSIRSQSLLAWDDFDPNSALMHAQQLINDLNVYIQATKPWEREDPSVYLNTLHVGVDWANDLFRPVFPKRCQEIDQALLLNKKVIIFNRIETVKHEQV